MCDWFHVAVLLKRNLEIQTFDCKAYIYVYIILVYFYHTLAGFPSLTDDSCFVFCNCQFPINNGFLSFKGVTHCSKLINFLHNILFAVSVCVQISWICPRFRFLAHSLSVCDLLDLAFFAVLRTTSGNCHWVALATGSSISIISIT